LAGVDKDLFFIADGEGDGLAVLALIRKKFDGGEDPRLVAGVESLRRIIQTLNDGAVSKAV
jgi:hypothetical protein